MPSRRGDEAQGFLNGLDRARRRRARSARSCTAPRSAPTRCWSGAAPRIGVITTRGFRDVLEMRRRDRRRTWGLWGDFVPIADRDMRLEVDERDAGRRHHPHRGRSGRGPRRGASCCSTRARRRVAIVFINAYANADNERARARRAARGLAERVRHRLARGAVRKSASSSAPRRRRSTPICSRWSPPISASSTRRCRRRSSPASSTSCSRTAASCRRRPRASCRCAPRCPGRPPASSPARRIAKAAGFDNVITCDLGGTSFDVSVIAGGKVAVAAQTTIDFGLVIRTPMIEITTIGAGGGSIASVDRGGLLQVGPESAGSVPGPACYGAGNTRPTLTDAQVVLGRINAARPLGGELKSLDVEAAKRAIATHVGEPLGLSTRRRRGGDRARRRCAHGRRHPPGFDRARPRSGALRRHAVRRRRRAARRRADPRDRAASRRWCRAFPASPRRSAACSPTCATTWCRRSTSCSTASTPRRLTARMDATMGRRPPR